MAPRILAVRPIAVLLVALACGAKAPPVEELRRFPIADLDGVLERENVSLDPAVTSDGNGSLRIAADAPRTVRLYETGDLEIEDARLLYRARLRTEDLQGQAYLEMWCQVPGMGEFFSRGLQSPLSGSVDWTTQEIPFLLQKGQDPDNVKLNVVVNGTGTVWIDDLVLSRGPLR